MTTIRQQKPATCDVCDGTPIAHTDEGWLCQPCYDIWFAGRQWADARSAERSQQRAAYDAIRQAHADGYPETVIASLAGVDRMTVRRALGKLR